jgi:hypothetical protein
MTDHDALITKAYEVAHKKYGSNFLFLGFVREALRLQAEEFNEAIKTRQDAYKNTIRILTAKLDGAEAELKRLKK